MGNLGLGVFILMLIGGGSVGHAAGAAGDVMADRTFLVRNRSFTPGAPAGWTSTEYAGARGADLINAQSPAVRAVLRLTDPTSNDPWPAEPRPTARGPLSQWTNDRQNLLDEKAEIERATTEVSAELKDLETVIKAARVDVELKRLRLDQLDGFLRWARIEVRRGLDANDAAAHLADLIAKDGRAQRELLRAEMAAGGLEQRRDRALSTANENLRQRVRANERALEALTGFYETDRIPGVTACARPWVYQTNDPASAHPFYAKTAAHEGVSSDTKIAICVSNGVLHAVYVMKADGSELARSLFGRDAKGRIDRIVVRDAKGALIEDHQYLPGPKGATRFGLTFRDAANKMISIYTDLPPRP